MMGLPGFGLRGRDGLFALALAFRDGMGMGDVKMGGILGPFLGPYAALTVFLGALLDSVVGGLLMDTGRAQRHSALVFGVFMAVASVSTLFLGREVWGSYLRLAAGGV